MVRQVSDLKKGHFNFKSDVNLRRVAGDHKLEIPGENCVNLENS